MLRNLFSSKPKLSYPPTPEYGHSVNPEEYLRMRDARSDDGVARNRGYEMPQRLHGTDARCYGGCDEYPDSPDYLDEWDELRDEYDDVSDDCYYDHDCDRDLYDGGW